MSLPWPFITKKDATIDTLAASQLNDFTYDDDRGSDGTKEEVDRIAALSPLPRFYALGASPPRPMW